MPIYEYRCTACGFEQEYLQKVSVTPLTVCPQCSQATFVKQLSAAGFQLKGSGWYATDFKNSGAKAKGKSDAAKAEDKAEGGGKEGGTPEKAETAKADAPAKSETKSETQSEPKSSDAKAA